MSTIVHITAIIINYNKTIFINGLGGNVSYGKVGLLSQLHNTDTGFLVIL